jgi:hypothetical protein
MLINGNKAISRGSCVHAKRLRNRIEMKDGDLRL